MKKLMTVLAAAATLGALVAPATAHAADPTKLEPTKLSRGDDSRVAHLQGSTLVDGDVRLRVTGGSPYVLGESGNGYVLMVRAGDKYRVVRVAPGKAQKTLLGGSPGQVVVSGDGETFAATTSMRVASVDIRSTRTGNLVGTGDFTGYPWILDLEGDHVVVASYSKGAVDYDWQQGTTRLITKKAAYAADLANNLISYSTKDPYDGGCSVVAPITDPTARVWTSCRERVTAFSPDGQRIATVHKLSDGPGPSQVWERTIDGDLLGSYTVGGYFGAVTWESDTDLLLDANGVRKAATVRCSEGDCERTTAVCPTPDI